MRLHDDEMIAREARITAEQTRFCKQHCVLAVYVYDELTAGPGTVSEIAARTSLTRDEVRLGFIAARIEGRARPAKGVRRYSSTKVRRYKPPKWEVVV